MKSVRAQESQNIEYKQSWHDDYLKWICGSSLTAKLPAPEFKEDFGGLSVVLKKEAEKTLVKSSEKILRLLEENPVLAIAELAEIIGISARAVEKNIKNLQQKSRLRWVGPDKGGHWEVKA